MHSISLTEIHGALLTYTPYSIQRTFLEEESSLEQLNVTIPILTEPESVSLQIFTANDLLQQKHLQLNKGEVSNILYFFIMLPFPLPSLHKADLFKILSVFNQLLPIGSFEVDEEDNLYYRYGLLLDEKWGDTLFITDIVNCLGRIIPRIYQWLNTLVIETNLTPQRLDKIKQEFKELIQKIPRQGCFTACAKHRFSQHSIWTTLFVLTEIVAAASVAYATVFLSWWLGVSLFFFVFLPLLMLFYQLRKNQSRLTHVKKQKQQLDFYWKLLEIERIKVQYQFQALQQQSSEVTLKLGNMSMEHIQTPGDLVRKHYNTCHLRDFECALEQRQTTLVHQKEELYRSCEHLYEEQKLFMAELGTKLDKLELGEFRACLSEYKIPSNPEQFLFSNLKQTLTFLDFKLQNEHGKSEFSVYTPTHPDPVYVGYRTRWNERCSQDNHSWMIVFYYPFPLKIPHEKLADISTLITMSNRFLPLGTLVLDTQNMVVGMKYHFIRGQGDISSFLVIEIIELLAFFGGKIAMKLEEFLLSDKTMSEILKATESEFHSLNQRQ